jgi:putative redox protein
MTKITLRWVESKLFIGTDSNGNSIVIGRTAEEQHPWVGVKPSELLLLSVASCASWDVVEILLKQRQPLRDLRVETSGEQLDVQPYRFNNIHNHYIVSGPVNPENLDKAIHLAEDKYCSVINSLSAETNFSSDFELLE